MVSIRFKDGNGKWSVPLNRFVFKISESKDIDVGAPTAVVDEDNKAVEGHFKDTCADTCYINMKMREGLYYTLKVKVDPDTELKIDELKYTLE